MIREQLSKGCALSILRYYYENREGMYSLLRKYGIPLKTQAIIRLSGRKFYIEGKSYQVVRTLEEVLG